ncbi:hypothetical protein BHM03_00061357 [Ensete ventricosum]|nr:hypothetical protein BHM03_00061357 [Ensete ventricosum]
MQPTHYRAAEVPTSGNRGNMRLTCYRVTAVLISGDKWEMQPIHYRAIEMSTVGDGETSASSLGHQHIGAIYHRGRIPNASTSESHVGDLIIQRYDQSGWRVDCSSAHIRLRKPDKSEDKAEGVRGKVEAVIERINVRVKQSLKDLLPKIEQEQYHKRE